MQIYPNSKEIKSNEDHRGNSLYNVKLHPLTTVQRILYGNSLDSSDQGIVVYDSDLDKLFSWGGGSWITSTSITRYVHEQSSPSSVWNIHHGLECRPSVTIVNSAGDTVLCSPHYIDNNNITINFGAAFSGEAYIN